MQKDRAHAVPGRLPTVPYEGHPLYGARKSGIGNRLFALMRVFQFSFYVIGTLFWQRLQRRSELRGSVSQELENDGLLPLRLTGSARDALKRTSDEYFARLERTRDHVGRGNRTYGDNQLDLRSADAPELYRVFHSILEQVGAVEAIRGYLGCRAEICLITIQINDEWDSFWRGHFKKRHLEIPKTAFFHVDNTYGVVKVIAYISDVGGENGPFSYVPGTHRIKVGWLESVILRATDIWLDVHPGERSLFASLPKHLRKKAKFGDDIEPDGDWGRWLLANERPMTSADGDLFIFDPKGIHRGGMVAKGERRIIQVMMR